MARRIATGSGGLVGVARLVEGARGPPGIVWAARGEGAWRGRRGRRGGGRGEVWSELCGELGAEVGGVEGSEVVRAGLGLEEVVFAGDNLGSYTLEQREFAAGARHACAHVTRPGHKAITCSHEDSRSPAFLFIGSLRPLPPMAVVGVDFGTLHSKVCPRRLPSVHT